MKWMGLAVFGEPLTFLTSRGVFKVRRARLFLRVKAVLIIIPLAPLSRRADALISQCDHWASKETLSVTEGECIL